MFKFLHDYLSVRKHLKQERKMQIKKVRTYYKTFFKEQLYSWLGHYFTQKSIITDPLSEEQYEKNIQEIKTHLPVGDYSLSEADTESFYQDLVTSDDSNIDDSDNQVNYSSGEELNVDDYITEEIARNVQQEQDEHGIIFDDMDKYNTIQLKDVIDINMVPNNDHSFVDYIYNVTDNQSIKEYIDKKREEINGE